MRNSFFRDWEFGWMDERLQRKECIHPLDIYDREWDERYWDSYYYYHPDFVIVYLENYQEQEKEGGLYTLLLDFFTLSDYLRFIRMVGISQHTVNELRGSNKQSYSTIFEITNYKSKDEPVRDRHYRLDLSVLREYRDLISPENKEDDFPIHFTVVFNRKENDSNRPLLYLVNDLVYPQWVFRSLFEMQLMLPPFKDKQLRLNVKDVGQGNLNEIYLDDKPCVIFDAGTDTLRERAHFSTYKKKLTDALQVGSWPLFVLSHWHTDHYSLLFSLTDTELGGINDFALPAYVKNLSVFLFVLRLAAQRKNVMMKSLPFSSDWKDERLSDNIILYVNKYIPSNVNNSGLTLFVQGGANSAMLPGDCRYKLVESEANDAKAKLSANCQKHYLVVPHHCGKAGRVSYNITGIAKKDIEGFVSVGNNNRHGHPDMAVKEKVERYVSKIRMTCEEGDIEVEL